jgi:CheY-like chemotaxis protein
LRILFSDDDRLSRTLIARHLEELGHAVTAVASAYEALRLLDTGAHPLLISDWVMPELSGLELVRRVRARELQRVAEGQGRRYTYLILLTARSDRQSFLDGMEAGADDFLTKPFDQDQLFARLRVAERIMGMHEELRRLSGLLPICSFCKRIREGDAPAPGSPPEWVPIESYVSHRSGASFSHSICPECYESRIRPQLDELRRRG